MVLVLLLLLEAPEKYRQLYKQSLFSSGRLTDGA